jgi:peptidoglycan/xylan/chitin deacetylase (PgdA/CDA1 family)
MEAKRGRSKGRHALTGLLLFLLTIAGASVALWRVSRARCFALTGPVVCRVSTERREVALTFDDGPTPLGVSAILPVLEAHRAKATFFVIGQEVARHPDLVRRLAAAGQELGNHSYTHQRMIGRPASFYDREIEETDVLLRKSGARSGFFRPPYGKKLFGLPLSVGRHGLRMILWDVEDPVTTDPRRFADQVVSQARPGSIILVHAMYPTDLTGRNAVPMILDGLDAKGLKVVTVGTLLKDASQR